MIQKFSDTTIFEDEISSENLVLIDFYADWCEPCKWLDIILETLDKEATFPLKILKVDTEKYPEISHEYQVKSIPVLLLFRRGRLLWRMNGFLSAPELLEKLETISRETT